MRKIVASLFCVALAGCWQSTGSLFADVQPVQPLAAGKVISFDLTKPGDIGHAVLTKEHAVLTKEKDGSYRYTITDKADQGDAVIMRLLALPGLPKDVFAFEAVFDDKCQPGQICHPVTATSERDYGLVRRTKAGFETISPNCDKSSSVAKLPGVKADDFGCSFSSRGSIETALLDLAKQDWKPDWVSKYE